MTKRVGFLGATGTVGKNAASLFAKLNPSCAIVMAGRNEHKGQEACDVIGPQATFTHVDYTEEKRLRAFTEQCDVVCNCAGPSDQIKDTVALSALETRTAYVDVAGEPPLHAVMQQKRTAWINANIPVVIGAGMLPGLSEIIPRWLTAQNPTPKSSAQFYYFGREAFSPGAAYDFVASIDSAAAIKEKPMRGGVLRGFNLPGLQRPCTAVPVFSPEAARVSWMFCIEILPFIIALPMVNYSLSYLVFKQIFR